MPSESPSIRELRFFTDRNLGSRIMPGVLRAAGWNVVTMNDFYGAKPGESIRDARWISEATELGFILLGADAAIASVPSEALAIHQSSARMFALTRANAQLRGAEQATLFLQNEQRIRGLARREGPYAFAVGRSSFREMPLRV